MLVYTLILTILFVIVFVAPTAVTANSSKYGNIVNNTILAPLADYIKQASAVNTIANDHGVTTFPDPINLSNNTRDSVYSQVAASENNVYVVWEEGIQKGAATTKVSGHNNSPNSSKYHDNRNYDIYFRKSNDRGLTFNKEVNLSDNLGFSEHPQIAVSGNNVYVVWTDDAFGNKEIMYRRSSDGGNTFGKAINLSYNNGDSFNQEIVAYGDNVYVTWEDKTTNYPSMNGDTNYRNNNKNSLKDNNTDNRIDNTNILIKSSKDGGNDFKNTRIITNNAGGFAESYPKIAASGNNVYVIWNVVMPSSSFNASDNNGVNNNNNSKDGVVKQGIFFTKSSDTGDSFSSIVKLNNQGSAVGESQIAASENQVSIVWSGNSDNLTPNNLFFIKSTDKGNSFTDEILLSKKSSLNAEIAVYGDNVYIPWQDILLKGNNHEILSKMSTDRGNTFTNTPKNISNNKGISECPSIAVSKNIVYIVWEDDTLGNHEIFFIRSDNHTLS